MKTLIYALLVLQIFNLNSCVQNENNLEGEEGFNKQQIFYSSNLLILKDNKLVKTSKSDWSNSSKLISIVDGVCMKCVVNDLNFMDSVFIALTRNSDVDVIHVLNVLSKDSLNFRTQFEPHLDVKGKVFWDSSYNFESQNNILVADKNRRVFLVDSNDYVKIIGNPVFDQDINIAYQKLLNELN
ncbi:MAG: hypothetical protein LAT68_12575 [Cyclobacteriaceae bacterium]|nr:hypothetical protein [Cyclobacteriaceae bacterium]MCH8517153.1 hypothetical protein [Cyclobacteriaceae bacterium]